MTLFPRKTLVLVLAAGAVTMVELSADVEPVPEIVQEEVPLLNRNEVKAAGKVEELAARDRQIDPFGLSMNPETGSQLELALPEDAGEQKVRSSLEEALGKLRVTGVLPKRGRVLIGARPLEVGDRFNIGHDGVTFRLMLEGVTLQALQIRDLDTSEVAQFPLGIMPSLHSRKVQPDQVNFQSMSSVLTIE